LSWKVQEAYTWLMDSWQRDDQVFLFGFSRGAYSARVLAGLLHALGLLPFGAHNMVPYAMKLFAAIRSANDPRPGGASADSGVAKYWALCDQFRWTFARPTHDNDDQRRFPTHFLGVWDTVSSVGWVYDPTKFQFTARNPSIQIARHAMSIDERRAFFQPNRLGTVPGQDSQQRWFPGVHCDVGGGYEPLFSNPPPVYSRLFQRPFQWMIDEARLKGLLIDDDRLQKVLAAFPASQTGWLDPQHESLTRAWWLLEWFPKLRYSSKTRRSFPYLNRGQHRELEKGELIDEWALRRIHDSNYAPPNLSPHFRQSVRALADHEIPNVMPYEP
jgi:uncharacterized protein (DUF2235 family)